MWKKATFVRPKVCQYSHRIHACNVARSYELSYINVDAVNTNEKMLNKLHKNTFISMVHISTLSIQSNYNVDSNTKYLNYMKH